MNIEMEQLELVKMLLTIRDEVTLGKVKDIIVSSHEEGRISIKQYNEEIEEALERVNSGKFITHDEVKAKAGKWRKEKIA